MKAVVYDEEHSVSVREIPTPSPGDGEVLVKVGAGGICGTDLHASVLPDVFTPGVVMGHEFAGTVVALGPGVDGVGVGTRVSVNPVSISCGTCSACLRGHFNQCLWASTAGGVGLGVDGGLAEYVAVDVRRVWALPETVSTREGALVEPLAVAVRGVRRAGVTAGSTVAILGAGPVGLLVGAVSRVRAAARIAIVEPSAGRRALAAQQGFGEVLDPSEVPEHRDAFDIVIDCAGAPAAVDSAVQLAAPGGTVMTVGWHTEPIVISDPATAHSKELTLGFSLAHEPEVDFAGAIELLRTGAVDVRPLISDVVPLERALDAFDRMRGANDVAKILIDCS
ncbi:zinc-dependent alcohol dehydrogenase [Microbacterium sp. RD1]|uniref:zinc-dependent alcohol dehydrogenase n=1 Tax=Microbacterium sp. RD1 TaxID=3457313 RepID=UPI003FA5B794